MHLRPTYPKLNKGKISSASAVKILFGAVLALSTFQLFRDLGGLNLSAVLANTPILAQLVKALSTGGADLNPSYLKVFNDNYTRCQNKLGVDYGLAIRDSFNI